MAGKVSKNKKQTKIANTERAPKRKITATQVFFTLFALILILSMILSSISNF